MSSNKKSYPKEYRIWQNLRSRCNNHRVPQYKNYGGRGITVCDRWNTFLNFLEDMGLCPPNHELDRTDNNKGYSPDNCRWVTKSQNCRNYRRNVILTMDGISKCLIEWAEEYNISYMMLYKRIIERKWDIKRALTQPHRYHEKIKNGKI